MSDPAQLEHYASLLEIRRAAGRRDATITGALFLLAALASFASSLLAQQPARTSVIPSAVTLALGIGYLTTWVRYQIAVASAEVVETVIRSASR